MARLLIIMCFVLCKGIQSNSLKLEQVLIVSRHNIRTPLTSSLEMYAPKTRVWPKFNKPAKYLTNKGAHLEGYLAEYISDWLNSENLINGCPKQEDVLIYSNALIRTIDTANSFASSAFNSCNITVQHKDESTVFDPLFHSVIQNNSDYFKQQTIMDMKKKLKEVNMTETYLELNKILDLENSDICKKEALCDLNTVESEPFYELGQEPDVTGPLRIATNIFDTFVMGYYEGFPLEDVAWGQIKTEDQWRILSKIIRQYHDVRFNYMPLAIDAAGPLLNYIFEIFRSGSPKLASLFGHDSNIATILCALDFKEFNLEGQYEPYPIGGKLVFQKWTDDEKKYLKVEYFYQSTLQLRNSVKLSLEEPPQRVLLELNSCKINENGFCPWEEFMKLNF